MKRSRLGGKISKYIMKNYSVFQIDTKEDLKFITTLLKSKIKKKTEWTVFFETVTIIAATIATKANV